MNRFFQKIVLLLTLLFSANLSAQDTEYDESGKPIITTTKKGFHVGLYTGVYFANQSTASAYDGYGFDIDGNKNNYDNSFMYNKIVQEYGGYGNPGSPDEIAIALGVDYHTWTFNENDMPTQMRYFPSFLLGLQSYYSADAKNKILFNVNATRLSINGNFTIMTPQLPNSTQINKRVNTFAIRGREQRLTLELGYQHLFGKNEKLNLLVEGGMNITITKFDKNEILINNLLIDLTASYYQPGAFNTYVTRKPIGTGFGAFAGIGANLNMSEKWIMQLLYNPTYEGINIVPDATLKMQHSIGLRAYYKL
jgi:hypothetical protein